MATLFNIWLAFVGPGLSGSDVRIELEGGPVLTWSTVDGNGRSIDLRLPIDGVRDDGLPALAIAWDADAVWIQVTRKAFVPNEAGVFEVHDEPHVWTVWQRAVSEAG